MVDFWKHVKTKPFDPDCLKKAVEDARNAPERMPTYTVCLADWRKIKTCSDEKGISLFSAYLELLNEGKVRPAFMVGTETEEESVAPSNVTDAPSMYGPDGQHKILERPLTEDD